MWVCRINIFFVKLLFCLLKNPIRAEMGDLLLWEGTSVWFTKELRFKTACCESNTILFLNALVFADKQIQDPTRNYGVGNVGLRKVVT